MAGFKRNLMRKTDAESAAGIPVTERHPHASRKKGEENCRCRQGAIGFSATLAKIAPTVSFTWNFTSFFSFFISRVISITFFFTRQQTGLFLIRT
jgi:hypothetical protein